MSKLKKDIGVIRRDFNYSLDGVSLNFSLRVDTKNELSIFAELLKIALKDVQLEIDKKI